MWNAPLYDRRIISNCFPIYYFWIFYEGMYYRYRRSVLRGISWTMKEALCLWATVAILGQDFIGWSREDSKRRGHPFLLNWASPRTTVIAPTEGSQGRSTELSLPHKNYTICDSIYLYTCWKINGNISFPSFSMNSNYI